MKIPILLEIRIIKIDIRILFINQLYIATHLTKATLNKGVFFQVMQQKTNAECIYNKKVSNRVL